MKPKYLKTYMGVVTDSLAGRDDGYPEPKELLFELDDDLIKDPIRPQEKVYLLSEFGPAMVIALRAKIKARNKEANRLAVQAKRKKREMEERGMLAMLKAKYEK